MDGSFVRRITCNEKFYIAMADCGINIGFRFMMRVDRAPSVSLFNQALSQALANCPVINVKYHRGAWYISDDTPTLKLTESDLEDVYTLPLPFMDYRKRTFTVTGIHQTGTDDWYISMDFFHGACDARSALSFVYDVFAALGRQPLTSYTWGITDMHIVKQYGKLCDKHYAERVSMKTNCALKDEVDLSKLQCAQNKFTADCTPRGITSKLAYSLVQIFSPKDGSVMIPVDIRPYIEGYDTFLFGNLSLPMFFQCRAKDDRQILSDMKEKLIHASSLTKQMSQYLPLKLAPMWLVRMVVNQFVHHLQRIKRFVLCGIVSHVGSVDASRLQSAPLCVTDMAFQVESIPLCGLSLTSLMFNDKLNVCTSCGRTRIDEATYRALTKTIRTQVV